MIKQLKHILNNYTDEELENMELWINSGEHVEQIIIDEYSIDLMTGNVEIRVNGLIAKERKDNNE